MNGSHVACICGHLRRIFCLLFPVSLLCCLEPKREKKTTLRLLLKTSPYITRLRVHNNTETLVSRLGYQRPSAASLQDTRNYTV